jgi:hypothetical protein
MTDTLQYEAPVTTTNQLQDILTWLKMKNTIVLIYNEYSNWRIFHVEENNDIIENADLSLYKIIAIKCQSLPGLLDDGEWEYYIKEHAKEYNSRTILNKINKMLVDNEKNAFHYTS